jgi:ABC-type oligopeptide transport system substrate-binding subunit
MTRHTKWLVALVAGVLALVAVGCAGGDDEAAGDNDQVITVNWGTEPPSLDPGLATDTTSSSILLNLMDPLVLLDENLEPQPGIAESWEVAGTTVTYHLRSDGRWTNGDPVTAQDYEWSWKRTISPDLAADYAYQFFGIVGAADYNNCKSNCDAMRDKVGVTAVNDRTLRVELTSPQPWFVQQSAHTSFLAVHRPTVEKLGGRWTEPKNIVTNGPFRLERWDHNSRIDLTKWDEWRNAEAIALERINGRMISEGLTAVQAFEANEIDAQVGGLPPEELPRLKDTEAYAQYPSLGTYYYGINVENVPDANQRRAMALAIDRQSIIDNVAQADQIPASGFTPQGMPGFETLAPDSEWLPAEGDIDRAKELMERVQSPQRNVTLVINDAPGHREIAVAIQDAWSELGIETEIQQQEWAQFLESIGPPPGRQIDAFRLGWIADYVDAMNFLELWTCDSGNNSTNYCNQEYDGIVEQARRTADDAERYELYGRLERILFGPDGDVPILPIYWYTFVQLEDPAIKDTFGISQTGQIDLRGVVEGDGGSDEDV